MKITLVTCFGEWQSGFDPQPFVPLGLLSIGAPLEKAGCQVKIIDQAQAVEKGIISVDSGDMHQQIAHLIHESEPDLVGFSTMCNSYPQTIELARHYRGIAPHIPIMFGGPQATVVDVETLSFPWVDWIVRGEADQTIIDLIDCLRNGRVLKDLPGITWRDAHGKIHRNPDVPLITNLDTLAFPAYYLYPVEEIEWMPIEAGRGCPFSCTFCSTSVFFHRRFRMKSSERLVAEMRLLHEQYGCQKFSLQHDMFTVNQNRVREFCRAVLQTGLPLKWGCSARIDCVDAALLDEMAQAGCIAIFFGVETGSARMQKIINKKLRVERIIPTVQAALQRGINALASFITAFPEETDADLHDTLNMLLDLNCLNKDAVTVQLHLLSPLVGSALYEMRSQSDLQFDGDFSDISTHLLSDAEIDLVKSNPRVFSSFYYLDTPYLSREKVKAISASVYSFPHLLLGLRAAQNGDLQSVFDRWLIWRKKNLPQLPQNYYDYHGRHFGLDFVQFLRDEIQAGYLQPPYLRDLVEYQATKYAIVRNMTEEQTVVRSFQYDVKELIQRLLDQKPVHDLQPCLTHLLFTQTDNEVMVTRVPPSVQGLLGLASAS